MTRILVRWLKMVKRVIRQSPSTYIDEPGVLSKLDDLIKQFSVATPMVVTDETVRKVSQPFLPADFYRRYPPVIFTGANTFAEAKRIIAIAKKKAADGIIALGGGQLMDNAKLVADAVGAKLINIQTVPSNCAALTTKSIVYNDRHEMVANVRITNPVTAVLLEPELLKAAPPEYVASGIGDTLAKYYEIRRRLPRERISLVTEQAARYFIDRCRSEMLKVTDLQRLSGNDLLNFLDTIFLFAASVDGFADLNGRSVAAHTFYNAYVQVKHPATFTHGVIVALGNLIQVLLEGNHELAEEIRHFYPHVGLPLTLADLGVNEEESRQIAEVMTAKDNVRMQSIFPDITTAQINSVFNQLGVSNSK